MGGLVSFPDRHILGGEASGTSSLSGPCGILSPGQLNAERRVMRRRGRRSDEDQFEDTAAMWTRFRKWTHGVVPPLVILSLILVSHWAEGSALWYAGAIFAGLFGLAYIVEEIVWDVRGKGRPRANCGKFVRMRSFRLRNPCPHCGEQP